MNNSSRFFMLVPILLWAQSSGAFDTETHALITRKAYAQSALTVTEEGSIVNRFGLDRLTRAPIPFASYDQIKEDWYYSDGGIHLPSNGYNMNLPSGFERCQMQEFNDLRQGSPQFAAYGALFNDTVDSGSPMFSSDTLLPIQNWLIRGAIREDDLGNAGKFFFSSNVHCRAALIFSDQEPSARSVNHFYDPYLDIGLTVPGIVDGQKSVDWALGYIDSFADPLQVDPNRGNFYSYSDARNMLWWALTREEHKEAGQPYSPWGRQQDADDHMMLWATTFRALGDVLHLLEDTGQPQHTRNDPHGGPLASQEQKAFEDYTNDRVLGTNQDLNSYVWAFFGNRAPPLEPPPLGNYPSAYYPYVTFSTPLRFFTTRGNNPDQTTRAGLADYTNRGFFTGGTLPGDLNVAMGFYPLPPLLGSYYGSVEVPCEGLLGGDQRLLAVPCKHYTLTVPDTVSPGYPDLLPAGFSQPPLASESIFQTIILQGMTVAGSGQVNQVALALEELDTIGNMSIPRAVGYATGMLNFFFRGSLQVTAPDDGVYAIVNHGKPHSVTGGVPYDSSGNVFGFTSVRLKVKNITMADGNGTHMLTESGTGKQVDQTFSATVAGDITNTQLHGPYLVAIARYHRNTCYQPDLSGEDSLDINGNPITAVNCDPATMRSAWPEISVSQSVAVAKGALDGSEAQLLTFDFGNDPIPVNATDVFFQVAYRGKLGDEQDGIAVGMVNVSEPTYYSVFNNTDYVFDPVTNLWRPSTSTEPSPLPLTYIEICRATGTGPDWKNWQIYRDNSDWNNWQDTSQPLPPGHVVRVAMLLDPNSTATFTADGIGFFQYQGTDSGLFFDDWEARMQVSGKQRQAADEQGTGFNPDPFSNRRSAVLGDYVSRMRHFFDGEHDGTNFTLNNPWPLDESYWTGTRQIQPLNSENIGDASAPGVTPCTFNYTIEYPESQQTAERITTANVSHRHASAMITEGGVR